MIFDPRIFFITTLLSQKIIAGTFAFHLYIPGLTTTQGLRGFMHPSSLKKQILVSWRSMSQK